MGTVAVIPETPILLHQMHVNLWILPGIGRQVRFLDIGFRFKVEEGKGEFQAFKAAIPGSGMRQPRDLSQKITEETGSLIFGMPIDRDSAGKISPATDLEPDYVSSTLVELSKFETVKNEVLEAGFGFWRCELAKPWTSADDFGYCRVRFVVPNPGRMWTRPGMSPLDGRSLFDLRILDVRESATSAIDVDIRNGGTEVREAVHAHLIVPDSFEVLDTSENHKYLRLLEAEAWQDYLGRRASLLPTRPKMVAVSWEKRGGSDQPAAEVTRPARFACLLRKQTVALTLGRLLTAIVVAMGVVWFLTDAELFEGGAVGDTIRWLNDVVPAKLSGVPGIDGTLEDLLEVVASLPVGGPLVGVAVLAIWPRTRRFLGWMRTRLEALFVTAKPHGSY